MDFFQHPRYVINKQLFRFIGLWPYQERKERIFFFSLVIFFSATILTVQIRKVVIDGDDSAVVIESIPPFIVHLGCGIKVVTCIVNADKMHQLLQRVKDDWNEPMGPEQKVLARFADDGRTFSIVYAVWIYMSMVIFLIVPFAPKIVVAFGWANFSTEAQFCIPIDYFVDSEEYFVYIQMHLVIGITIMITIYVSVDVMFVVLVQHASGLFSSIGYRLEHLLEGEDLRINLYPTESSDETYWIVIDCIKKHKAAIKFTNNLDDMYSTAFLCMMAINIPVMSFTGLQVIWGMDKPAEAFRQGMLTVSELLHLFFECYFSQRLTDHSLQVLASLYRTRWYKTSMRTRKLLNFMIMRSMIPSELKAGKMYTMSMENFSAVVRTSMSYFTLLCSMQ